MRNQSICGIGYLDIGGCKTRCLRLCSLLSLLVIIGALNVAGSHDARAEVQVFESAPAPEVLAAILFPPRYRSADILPADAEAPGRFGLMINFAFDSDRILPNSLPLLESVGEMLGFESVAGKGIVVVGHTDAIGSSAYNQQLSERRARAIKRHLVDRYGIAPERLLALGEGERQLHLVEQPTAAINRRATFRAAAATATDPAS